MVVGKQWVLCMKIPLWRRAILSAEATVFLGLLILVALLRDRRTQDEKDEDAAW